MVTECAAAPELEVGELSPRWGWGAGAEQDWGSIPPSFGCRGLRGTWSQGWGAVAAGGGSCRDT